jgi:hypothetical protein
MIGNERGSVFSDREGAERRGERPEDPCVSLASCAECKAPFIRGSMDLSDRVRRTEAALADLSVYLMMNGVGRLQRPATTLRRSGRSDGFARRRRFGASGAGRGWRKFSSLGRPDEGRFSRMGMFLPTRLDGVPACFRRCRVFEDAPAAPSISTRGRGGNPGRDCPRFVHRTEWLDSMRLDFAGDETGLPVRRRVCPATGLRL